MDLKTTLLFASAAHKFETKMKIGFSDGTEVKGRIRSIIDNKFFVVDKSLFLFSSEPFLVDIGNVNYVLPDR